MPEKGKSGWLWLVVGGAGAAVLLLLCAITGLVGYLAWEHYRWANPPVQTDPLDAHIPKVANHRFWKKPLSEQEVRKLVQDMRTLPPNTIAYVDEHGSMQAITVTDPQKDPRFHGGGLPPSGIRGNYWTWSTEGRTSQPTETEMVGIILRNAEATAYRPPPF